MISYIKLKKYKSFSNIYFDLRDKHNIPKNIAYIYGENGSGKTNLISSVDFISSTFDTLKLQRMDKKYGQHQLENKEELLNDPDFNFYLYNVISNNPFTLKAMIENCKMLNSYNENMFIEIGFYINSHHGIYIMEFNDSEIIHEKLSFVINDRKGTYFDISKSNIKMSPSVFTDSKYKKTLSDLIKQFWGKHTFMSIMNKELEEKNRKYLESSISANFFHFYDFIYSISTLRKAPMESKGKIGYSNNTFLNNMDNGYISIRINEKYNKIQNTAKLLKKFYTSLYSDILDVYYNEEIENEYIKYDLFFKKRIGKKVLNIPVNLESSGTRHLLLGLPFFIASVCGKTVFADEIESNIHDVLFDEFMKNFSNKVNGQFIATTHNTNLMNGLDPKNIYILATDFEGEKEIISIDDYEERVQKNHNIQNKYLRGDFDGIPITKEFDLFSTVNGIIKDSNCE